MTNASDQFRPGALIAGTAYRVQELIGSGGMGNVYRVEHLELGKLFVLKALHRHLASRSDLVARMRNEWRALAKLNHPNIVQVTDAGTTGQGLPYYVMENLRGATVAQILDERGRLPLRAACSIMCDVLSGLFAAHQAGAIHRDIKPPNIFLVEDGTTKLLDFGIAKLRDQAARVVTAGGISIGTPRFMAPEQAEGTQVDGRVDIYASGLVLYHLLVGRGPFAHIRDPNELVMAHISLEPERADLVDASVPPEMGDLLQRWLAKSPSNRPPTADIARRELLALVETFPVEEGPEGEEVTWAGSAYDASTFGANAEVRERSFPVSDPHLVSGTPSPQSADADSTSFGISRTETLDREAPESPAASHRPGKTLGWGTQGADDSSAPSSGSYRARTSTPPPVSAPPKRRRAKIPSSVRWMGATAAVSFLIAFGGSRLWPGLITSADDAAEPERAASALVEKGPEAEPSEPPGSPAVASGRRDDSEHDTLPEPTETGEAAPGDVRVPTMGAAPPGAAPLAQAKEDQAAPAKSAPPGTHSMSQGTGATRPASTPKAPGRMPGSGLW